MLAFVSKLEYSNTTNNSRERKDLTGNRSNAPALKADASSNHPNNYHRIAQ